MKTQLLLVILLLLSFLFSNCNKQSANNSSSVKTTKNDSLVFGDTKFSSDGLMGKVYLLPVNTSKIPDFDNMNVADTIYTHSLNIPNRTWSSGFPGLPDRSEWFGIEYTGYFRAIKKGHYKFRLVSDDGSKLFIDDTLIINNDGGHGAISAKGETDLDNSEHSIKVQYFQGPRFNIALQLFATLEKQEEQLFPGTYFELNTRHSNNFFGESTFIIIICLLLLILILALYMNRKRKLRKQLKTNIV